MSFRKSLTLSLLLLMLGLLSSACADGGNNLNAQKSAPQKSPAAPAPVANIDNLLKKQILLTNAAEFTDDRTLEGASGFLIKYNGAILAVTARHLLGEAGGVEPEIKIGDLNKSLLKWEMKPRVVTKAAKETIKLSADGFDYSQSVNDFVLLKVVSEGFEIEPLTPNFQLPEAGETLFLIGCPYSETKCKQNSYPVTFVEFDEAEGALVCEITSKVALSGFSGAPLVNAKGEAVGVLVSSGPGGGKNYVLATHIKEMQKIKF